MKPFYRFCRFFCQWFCILFFRARLFGRPNVPASGGVFLVCNHQSFFDPILVTMALAREGNYMARDTLFRNPLFRRLITSVNAFPIRRNAADFSAVKETLRRLRAGRMVVTFPEGTRTRDGAVGRFLPGAAALAIKAHCTLVPVRIDGAFRSWPRHQSLPKPAQVHISYGEPFTPEQVRGYNAQQLTDLVRERIIALARSPETRTTIIWPSL